MAKHLEKALGFYVYPPVPTWNHRLYNLCCNNLETEANNIFNINFYYFFCLASLAHCCDQCQM